MDFLDSAPALETLAATLSGLALGPRCVSELLDQALDGGGDGTIRARTRWKKSLSGRRQWVRHWEGFFVAELNLNGAMRVSKTLADDLLQYNSK